MRCEQGEDDEEVAGESVVRVSEAAHVCCVGLAWECCLLRWSGMGVLAGGTLQCVVNASFAKSPDIGINPFPSLPPRLCFVELSHTHS